MSNAIDWTAQWALYAPAFKNGLAHILLPTQEEIQLSPGPGFGDFSHPTTQLMVELMAPYLAEQIVFDIGCGSGILSLAASKMGASQVYSCDIDPDAVSHTKQNAELNQCPLFFAIPSRFLKKPVILMNMIGREQEMAWDSQKRPFQFLITSGILTGQKETYLQFAEKQNWQLVKCKEKDNWLGCIFKEKP